MAAEHTLRQPRTLKTHPGDTPRQHRFLRLLFMAKSKKRKTETSTPFHLYLKREKLICISSVVFRPMSVKSYIYRTVRTRRKISSGSVLKRKLQTFAMVMKRESKFTVIGRMDMIFSMSSCILIRLQKIGKSTSCFMLTTGMVQQPESY